MDNYYPKCNIKYASFHEALLSVGADCRFATRKKIAKANDIIGYNGEHPEQDKRMLDMLKKGRLLRPEE